MPAGMMSILPSCWVLPGSSGNYKEEWEGTVKLIFQPGEERNPGGASLLIKEGVLENPQPQAIFGLHVHPGLETGKLSFRSGQVMASADELYFTIRS